MRPRYVSSPTASGRPLDHSQLELDGFDHAPTIPEQFLSSTALDWDDASMFVCRSPKPPAIPREPIESDSPPSSVLDSGDAEESVFETVGISEDMAESSQFTSESTAFSESGFDTVGVHSEADFETSAVPFDEDLLLDAIRDDFDTVDMFPRREHEEEDENDRDPKLEPAELPPLNIHFEEEEEEEEEEDLHEPDFESLLDDDHEEDFDTLPTVTTVHDHFVLTPDLMSLSESELHTEPDFFNDTEPPLIPPALPPKFADLLQGVTPPTGENSDAPRPLRKEPPPLPEPRQFEMRSFDRALLGAPAPPEIPRDPPPLLTVTPIVSWFANENRELASPTRSLIETTAGVPFSQRIVVSPAAFLDPPPLWYSETPEDVHSLSLTVGYATADVLLSMNESLPSDIVRTIPRSDPNIFVSSVFLPIRLKRKPAKHEWASPEQRRQALLGSAGKLTPHAVSTKTSGIFFSGELTVNAGKGRKTARVCLLSDRSIQVQETIVPLKDLTLVRDKAMPFSLNKGKERVFKFYPDSELTSKIWIRAIESLLANKNRKLLDFLLVDRLGISHTSSLEDFITAVFCSNCQSFTILLLNETAVKSKVIKLIIHLCQAKRRLEFFVRTLLLAEVSKARPDSMFASGSRYSVAYLSLFIASSKDWLISLATNFIHNDVTTAEQFFELLFVAFGQISGLPLLFTRSVCLALAMAEIKDCHPLIPFFEFLLSALRLILHEFFEPELPRLELVRGAIHSILGRPDQLQSPSVQLLAPFYHRLLGNVPHIETPTLKPDTADTLYRFLVKTIGPVMKVLGQLPTDEPAGNPLVYVNFQNLTFVTNYPAG
jgi:hypothetical protein